MVAVDEKPIRRRNRKIACALTASCAWQDSIQFCETDFAPSLLRGENNYIGAGGDSRCVGISAVGFGFDGSLNNTGLDQFGRIAALSWETGVRRVSLALTQVVTGLPQRMVDTLRGLIQDQECIPLIELARRRALLSGA